MRILNALALVEFDSKITVFKSLLIPQRKRTLYPGIVPKHQTMSEELEECIQLLYAKGMSNSDIVDFVESTYGVSYSPS
ncbi:MAG: transposase-like protein [Parvicellaceae bacterium]